MIWKLFPTRLNFLRFFKVGFTMGGQRERVLYMILRLNYVFIFSLLTFFWLSLSIKLLEGKGAEVKVQGGTLVDGQSFSGEGSKQRS